MSDRIADPLVIGLSGYARAGKDTVARILTDRGWQQRSFAAPLKRALYTLNPICHPQGWTVQQVVNGHDWEKAKDEFPMIRELLQRMGTEVGRNLFGENFWVEQACADLQPRVVFSDVRFPNEADACKTLGGQVWRIERPGCSPVNGHPSETALDGYDFDRVIVNNGTLDDLAAGVAELLDGAREVV